MKNWFNKIVQWVFVFNMKRKLKKAMNLPRWSNYKGASKSLKILEKK